MRRTTIFILVLAAVAGGAVWLAASRKPEPAAETDVVRVHATFYPLAEAARRIGGAHVSVVTMTPPGAEPHDYEPTPRDIAEIGKGSVFVMNGGVDAWADRVLPDLRARGAVVARASDRLPEIGEDPHVWLDPVRAAVIGDLVRDALIDADPVHAAEFRANAAAYAEDLRGLDRAYQDGLAECEIRTVVTSHEALGYLAERYGFTAVPIAGIDPEEEPSPRQMAEIVDEARKAGVKYVFFESLISPKLAETVASEIGGGTLVFDPIEGLSDEAAAAGEEYFSVMRGNLAALRTAMLCR